MTSCEDQVTVQPAPSVVVYEPNVAGARDGDGAAGSHVSVAEQTDQCSASVLPGADNAAKAMCHAHLQPDVLAQEARTKSACWAELKGGQGVSLKNGGYRLPFASQSSHVGVERELQAGPANLRAFLTQAINIRRVMSPIPEMSPLIARDGKLNEDTCTRDACSLYQQFFAEDCANIIDEIQRCPNWATAQRVERAGPSFGPGMNSLDISTISAEPTPNLDFTLESSCLQPEAEPLSKLLFSLPRLRNLGKIKGFEECEKTFAVHEEEEGAGFSSKENLVPFIMEKMCSLNGNSSIWSASTSLNSMYNLSHCNGIKEGLLETAAGNITIEAGSGVGPILKEVCSTQASACDTHMLHSDSAPTESNSSLAGTGVFGPTVDAKVKSKNDTFDRQPSLVGEVVSNLTVDVTRPASWMEDSTKSMVSKNHTFDVTLDLIKSNFNGPEIESTAKRSESQNAARELQLSQSDKPTDTGPHANNLCVTVETTEAGVKSSLPEMDTMLELGSPGDSFMGCVCADDGGAEEWRGSERKLWKTNTICSQTMDSEDGTSGSLLSLDGSLDMKAKFLVTSTPLVVPKVFTFSAKSTSLDVCKKLSVDDYSAGPATIQVDQLPPDGAKPPTKSLARPGSLNLRSGAKPPPSNPVDRKSLARPSGLPSSKLLHHLPRPSTSRLPLTQPLKMLPAPQVSVATSLLSSALTSISGKTGSALRNIAPSSALEASLGLGSTRRGQTVAESKLSSSGLLKTRTSAWLQASSSTSQLALRPPGLGKTKLQIQKPAATSSRPLGLRDPKGKGVHLPTSSQKQPQGNTDSLPIAKKKKMDAPGPSTNTEVPACTAGGRPGLRGPGTRLRAPQTKMKIWAAGSSPRRAHDHDSTAPPPPSAQPTPAPDAPLPSVSWACEGDPQLTNGSAGPQVTDCESCAGYRQEIERLRAELRVWEQKMS